MGQTPAIAYVVSSFAALRRRAIVSACAFVFVSCVAFVIAQDKTNTPETAPAPKGPDLTEVPLEELMKMEIPTVYSASKFTQKTTEAPSSISVVTAEEIKHYGYRTLADILRSLQGFYVSYDRNYAFLGTRGINLGDFNSRTLVLVNGHRINNNLTDGAYIDTAFILDVDLVDRVEVIRGPGSVLYGNNALFGVINVVTRKGGQLNGVEVSGEYGSFDAYKGRLTLGKAFTNGLELLLSGSWYHSDGPEDLFYPQYNTPAQNNGVAHNLDDDEYGSFFGSISYQDFALEGAFIRREKGNPTAQYFTTFNDDRLRTIDERSYASLKYAHQFPDIVDVTAQLYYDRSGFDIGYPLGSPVAAGFFKESQAGEWWGTELQLSRKIWDRHMLTAGAEYRDDFRQDQRVFDPNTGQNFTDNHRTRQSYGAYAEGDFEILTNLHLNAGVRFDRYGEFDPKVNPRVAAIYSPFEQSTFKAIYASAFRTPNFLELSDPRFQDIRPEEIKAVELVYEQGIGRYLRSSISGFYNFMDNLIVFENGNFTNLDATSKGIELALEGNWHGIRGRGSYTFQDVRNTTQDSSFADSPEHLFKFNVSIPFWKDKIFAGLEYQYTSRRSTLFTTTTGETLPGTDVSSFGVVNLTLFSQNLLKNFDFSASVYNVLNQHYADPATHFHLQDQIPQDGRTFRLKLTYRF
jgi:outer membrane receptor for ferrienterochelin and colicins